MPVTNSSAAVLSKVVTDPLIMNTISETYWEYVQDAGAFLLHEVTVKPSFYLDRRIAIIRPKK